MKAAVVGDRGVAVRDVPRPAPAPNEVLIRVHASSLNRADLIVASGQPHGKLFGTGSRLGLECAGEVEARDQSVNARRPVAESRGRQALSLPIYETYPLDDIAEASRSCAQTSISARS